MTLTLLLSECFDFINHCLGLDIDDPPPEQTSHPLERIVIEEPPTFVETPNPNPKTDDVNDFGYINV